MPRKDVHVLILGCSFLYQKNDNMNIIYTHPQTHSYTTAYTSSMYILKICTHYFPLHRICKQVKESDELRSLWRTWDGSWKQKNMQQMSCRPVQVKVSVRSLRICVLLPPSSLFIAASCSSCLSCFELFLYYQPRQNSPVRCGSFAIAAMNRTLQLCDGMQQPQLQSLPEWWSDGVMLHRLTGSNRGAVDAAPCGCTQCNCSWASGCSNRTCLAHPYQWMKEEWLRRRVKGCERSKMNWTKNRRGIENQLNESHKFT